MNGLQLLFFNDYVPKDFSESTTSYGKATFNNEQFLHALAAATESENLNQSLSDETLSSIVQQISELLQLSDADIEKIWELVHSLSEQEQNETFIKELVISVNELLAISPPISEEEIIEPLMLNLTTENGTKDRIYELFNNTNFKSSMPLNMPSQHLQTKEEHIDHQRLLQQFNQMMQSISSEEGLMKKAPEILRLLEQFHQLNQSEQLQLTQLMNESDDELQRLFKELMSRFSKRTNFAKQATYNTESKVTTTDVIKWMKHLAPTLLTKTTNINEAQTIAPNILKTQTMSPIEQYVIYMQRSENDHFMNEQLLKQFRQIVQTSQFSPTQSLTNQLAITLRPDNLGEMLVRFVEVNGEMAVKIIVSSQATKSILESNIHQLKHMFAPHQVSIEKVADGQEVLPKDDSFMKDEDAQEQHDEQQHDDDENLTQEKEHLDFHKILHEFV
ncbi:MAG TPA: flagellar hook-length control protein FliK [Bacillota bacterium]|nr:flagellar hook-length control protein FliK [Bacillota bacterium]